MTKVDLWNQTDLDLASRGLTPPEAVRKVTVEAMVDTGAVTMVIPEEVAEALGLSLIHYGTATLADGTKRQIPSMGPLRVEIFGRPMVCSAYVTPPGTMPLIGQIPLEALDLIVDPGTREVRVRSADGPMGWLLQLAA